MQRVVSVVLCLLYIVVVLSGCTKRKEQLATDQEQQVESYVDITIFAEPVDKELDSILDEIHDNISAQTDEDSLEVGEYCISLLNWCEATTMMDDEILYLVLTYMSELPAEEFSVFQTQMERLFYVQREFREKNSAGISAQASWSAMAIQHFNSIMDAAGVDVYNYPF